VKYPQYVVILGVGMVGSTGCVDAGKAYDDYAARLVDADLTPPPDGEIVSDLPDVNGEFLMAARPDLPEDRILYLRVMATFRPVTSNTGLYGFDAHFLDYTTLEEVGGSFVASDVEVGTDASFDDAPMRGTIVPAANPISGSNAVVDGLLIGTLVSPDFMCGTMSGTAGALNLAGSTWAAVRITGDELPPAVWRCEDQPAP
jgi:hypothetical protein